MIDHFRPCLMQTEKTMDELTLKNLRVQNPPRNFESGQTWRRTQYGRDPAWRSEPSR